MQRQHFPSSQPLPGVPTLLQNLSKAEIHLALATSSHSVNYTLKTSHLSSLFSLFPASQRVLGDDPRIKAGRGKPAPDIYFLALKTINATLKAKGDEKYIRPEECLVFEDSVPGVEAGRRAGMRVVWCPHLGLKKEFDGQVEKVLAGRCETESREDDKELGSASESGSGLRGWPSEIADGWGVHLDSLEDFPYERFGIVKR